MKLKVLDSNFKICDYRVALIKLSESLDKSVFVIKFQERIFKNKKAVLIEFNLKTIMPVALSFRNSYFDDSLIALNRGNKISKCS